MTGTDLNNDGSIDATDRELNISTSEVITIKWSINGVNQAGKTISVRTTRGTLNNSTVTTDSSGEATFQVASDTAGSATITAESDSGLVATLDREFVATTPVYLNTEARPFIN